MLFQLRNNASQILGHEYGLNSRDAALKSVRRAGSVSVRQLSKGTFRALDAQGKESGEPFTLARINDEPLPLG